jgi:hypothetical protein
MKYKLIKLPGFSGKKATIYTVSLENKNGKFEESLFEVFIKENKNTFISEIKDIFVRLKTIGNDTGARESFFKLNEGNPGDGVCALYDSPDKKLRLYCIRYGTQLIVLGGGGPKNTKTLQDDSKLKDENYLLRMISEKIYKCMQNGDLSFSCDYMSFAGNLTLED